MWKIKGCPRCRGDLYITGPHNVQEEKCLQCGYTVTTKEITVDRVSSSRYGGKFGGYHMRIPEYRDNCGRRF